MTENEATSSVDLEIEQQKKPAYADLLVSNGADGVTRTLGLLITNQLLYQLSHISIFRGAISRQIPWRTCN